MKKNEQQKNKDSNRKYYITGEICGKISIIGTGVVLVSMTVGMACMLIWDFKERKVRRNNKK